MGNAKLFFENARTAQAKEAESARFMSRVYAWMTAGVCISGGVAYYIGQNVDIAVSIATNRPLFWTLFIAQLGAVIFLSAAIKKVNSITAASIYLAYAALTGVTLSVIFLVYTQESIGTVFGLTAFSFAGLSSFGYVTKRDLGPIGSFCTMGLFGMIGYGLLSMFFPDMMTGVADRVYSVVGIIVFSGLTAYDTQKIKEFNVIGNEGSDEDRKEAVFGALTLYLDFVNLFLSLLRLFGKKK